MNILFQEATDPELVLYLALQSLMVYYRGCYSGPNEWGQIPVIIWHGLQYSKIQIYFLFPPFPSRLVHTGASIWRAKSNLFMQSWTDFLPFYQKQHLYLGIRWQQVALAKF